MLHIICSSSSTNNSKGSLSGFTASNFWLNKNIKNLKIVAILGYMNKKSVIKTKNRYTNSYKGTKFTRHIVAITQGINFDLGKLREF